MKKKRKINSEVFGVVALMTFMMATSLAVFGLSQTVNDIDEVAISHTPEAILASAGVSEDQDIYLSVAYFDQRSDECENLYEMENSVTSERQFEWTKCGYIQKSVEQGLVENKLDQKYMPVAKGGKLTPNKGMTNLDRWFESVDGKSMNYTGALKLNYTADEVKFSFYQDQFYPLDEADFSSGDIVNEDGHNHLFTMNFAVPFTMLGSGSEEFSITADDDTFVFLGDQLVIDMGGIHEATNARFLIHENGDVYTAVGDGPENYSGITLEKMTDSIVRIIHADRDSADSVFGIGFRGMNLNIIESKLASRDGESLQIAYDPTDPTYVPPLGQSSVVEPDNTKSFIVIATIEGLMVIVFAVLMAASIRVIVKKRLAKINR